MDKNIYIKDLSNTKVTVVTTVRRIKVLIIIMISSYFITFYLQHPLNDPGLSEHRFVLFLDLYDPAISLR